MANTRSVCCFANLRAGPLAQIRCLVEALHEDLLPFQNDCVHVLVKQLLFHVGNGWKTDLDANWNGTRRIVDEMRQKVELLRESPKDCDQVLLFGAMCSYFGLENEALRKCARDFANMCRKWPDDVGSEVKSSDKVSPELYWKQAKLYGYSMLCRTLGRFEDTDCKEMAELIVLFRSRALYASDLEESTSLDQPILECMTTCIHGILAMMSSHMDHFSHCLAFILDDVPKGLQWSPVKYQGIPETACFEAYSGENLFSINILNGALLVDGVPPGTLPASVVEDSLYRRTFGERNFKMVALGPRRYRAARAVDDRFLYEFLIDSRNIARNGTGHIK